MTNSSSIRLMLMCSDERRRRRRIWYGMPHAWRTNAQPLAPRWNRYAIVKQVSFGYVLGLF